jgi:histidyl-tRNA synthetase
MFLGREVPACGFSLGLERIIVVMAERGMFPATVSRGHADVMIACLDEACRRAALALAADLRGAGLRVDVYPDAGRKLEKPLKYASSRQVPLLAIVGPDELARGEVALRHLGTRQQVSIPRAEVVRAVERQLAETGKDAE